MASFTRDDCAETSGLPADCPLRMRVSRSAIGSFMLMSRFSSPARLAQARHVAAHRRLAQLDAPEAELAVVAARAPGDRAAAALARRARVARQLLQRLDRGHAVLLRALRVADLLLELRAFGRVLLHHLGPA